MTSDRPPDDFDPQLTPSAEFTEDLTHLFGPPAGPPADLDRRVAAVGRAELPARVAADRQRRWRSKPLAGLLVYGAAAATIGFVVWVGVATRDVWNMPKQAMVSTPTTVVVMGPPEDYDGNGRVDILDAFALAKVVEGGYVMHDDGDINGDGEVDDRDVQAVAAAAVKLDGTAG